jgi:hypothetical protein
VSHGTKPASREGGLRCRHVSRSSKPASWCRRRALASPRVPWNRARQERALMSPHVPQFQTHSRSRRGSGVVMCPVALGPPPDRGGLWCPHVSHGSRPASWSGRALTLSRVTWLSECYGPQAKEKYSASLLTRSGPPASEACPHVPKGPDIRLIMTSPGTRSRHRKAAADVRMGMLNLGQQKARLRLLDAQQQYNTKSPADVECYDPAVRTT